MSFDLSTLYLVAALIAALLGGLVLLVSRQENRPILAWWGYAYLLGATSVALWALAGPWLGETLALLLDVIGLLACGMVWNAARVFHGRKPNWPGLFAGALLWIAAVVLLPAEAADERMIVGAAIVSGYAILTASQLSAERRKAMRRWPSLLAPLLHGAVLMLPVVLAELNRQQDGSPAGNVWVLVFALELVLYAVGTVFVVLMLASERTIRAHKTAASVDPLTGMFNRRGFSEATAQMIEGEAAAGRPVTAMIFDIDHFKSVNDRFGHPAGDEVLQLFASIVSRSLRATDLCGRIGGEEFAAMLPCPIDEALIAAERVRLAFAGCGLMVDDAPVATTVSIGVASGPARTALDVLLAAADTALYQAKRGGRNQVKAASDQPVPLDQRPPDAAPAPKPKPKISYANA